MGNIVFHHKNRSKVGRQMGSAWASLVMAFPVLFFTVVFGGRICLFISTKPRGGGVHLPTQPQLFRGIPVPGL